MQFCCLLCLDDRPSSPEVPRPEHLALSSGVILRRALETVVAASEIATIRYVYGTVLYGTAFNQDFNLG